MEEKTHAGKPDPGDATTPKGRFRWMYFMVGMVALLLCLALICWFSILPRFVDQRLIDTLKGLGFEQVSLQVEEVGLGEARVTNIRLGGKDPVVIGKITTRYRLVEAMGGQLGTVDIEGLELKAVMGTNGVWFPQLENLSLPESDEPMDRLPFEEISIRSAKLFLEDPGRKYDFMIESELTRLKSKEISAQFSVREKSLDLSASVLIASVLMGEETVKVNDGTLALKCNELPVCGYKNPLSDVFLELAFDGMITAESTVVDVNLLSPAKFETGEIKRFAFEGEEPMEIRPAKWEISPAEDSPLVVYHSNKGTDFIGLISTDELAVTQSGWELNATLQKNLLEVGANGGKKLTFLGDTRLQFKPTKEWLGKKRIKAKKPLLVLDQIKPLGFLPEDNQEDWSIVGGARLTAGAEDIELSDQGLSIPSLEVLPVTIEVTFDKGGLAIALDENATIKAENIRYKRDDQSALIKADKWIFPRDDKKTLLDLDNNSTTVNFDGEVIGKIINIRLKDFNVGNFHEISGEITSKNNNFRIGNYYVERFKGHTLTVESNKTDTEQFYSLKIPASPKTVEALVELVPTLKDLDLPNRLGADVSVTNNVEIPALWKYGINNLTIGSNTIPPITGKLRLTDVGQQFSAACELIGGLTTEIKGNRTDKGESYTVKIPSSPKTVEALGKFFPESKNMDLPGQLGVEVTVANKEGTPELWEFGINNLTIGATTISPLTGEVRLTEVGQQFNAECELIDGLTAEIEGNRTGKGQIYTIKIPSSPKTVAALRKFFPSMGDLNMPDRLGVDVMVTNNADSSGPWKFGINNLIIGPDTMPPINGEARLTEDGQQFNAECELIDGLTAEIEGNRTDKGQSYTVKIPPTNISDKSALGNLFHLLEGFEIGGTIGLEANSDGTESQVQLSLKDCSLASSALSAIVEGLSGTILINGVSPFTTAGAQRITVNSARLGNLELVNGLSVFRLESGDIFIEEARWSLKQDKDGRFVARNFWLPLGRPEKVDIEVQDLDLGTWLGLLTDGQVVASGKLSGRVPITWLGLLTDGQVVVSGKRTTVQDISPAQDKSKKNGAKRPWELEHGAFLKTKKPGKLQFCSAEWAGEWLESVDPRFRTDPVLKELRQSVVEALQDFSYSSIRFDYNKKTDIMRVEVRGEGKNRQGKVVKFDPNININLFSMVINTSNKIYKLYDQVNRDLDNLFGD